MLEVVRDLSTLRTRDYNSNIESMEKQETSTVFYYGDSVSLMSPSGTLAEEDEEHGLGMDENNGTKDMERRGNISISTQQDLNRKCEEDPAKVKSNP